MPRGNEETIVWEREMKKKEIKKKESGECKRKRLCKNAGNEEVRKKEEKKKRTKTLT